jgi:signal transduction histidine kinase
MKTAPADNSVRASKKTMSGSHRPRAGAHRGKVADSISAFTPDMVQLRLDQAYIARAKQEWESAIDAASELICLVDRQGRVLRINRSVERWGFGPLRAALGASLHSLMHPRCSGRKCLLHRGLAQLSSDLQKHGIASLQVEDPRLGKVVSFEARAIAPAAPGGRRGTPHALLVVSDITALTQAQDDLRCLNSELEVRVQARTVELERANAAMRAEIERREAAEAELRKASDELSLLSVQLMRAQEQERQRIAVELHDSIGQSLSAIKYTLEHAAQLGHAASGVDGARRLTLAISQVQRLIGEVRAISSHLRPTALDGLGVVSAAREFCREWSEVYQHIELTVNIAIEDVEVPETLRTATFRAIQETLNNVARHSSASRAWVSIHRTERALVVEVADNGVGIAPRQKPAEPGHGVGLPGLRERAAHKGGELEVVSGRGKGTLIRITWPIPGAERLPEKVA